MQKEKPTNDNPGKKGRTIPGIEPKLYKVKYDMLGKDGIISITMDGWFTYNDALAVIQDSISWMKSASIVKVEETVVKYFTKTDFEGGD